jgi:hypothetical protein
MAGNAVYKISSVTQSVFLDKKGNAVNGWSLVVELMEWDEQVTLNLPTDDPTAAKAAIAKLIANRKALAELGE